MQIDKILYTFFMLSLVVLALATIISVRQIIAGAGPRIRTIEEGIVQTIRIGDIVELDYRVRLKNGSEVGTFSSISFTAGSNEVIQGLSEAVLGLGVRDNKSVEIPPEMAFGKQDTSLIETVLRLQPSPRIQNSNIEEFVEKFGESPEKDRIYRVPELNWPITVLEVESDSVAYRYDPEPNTKFDTLFGKADVVVTDDEIWIILPEKTIGDLVETDSGTARITDVTNESFTIDFNHELAGETLIFDIKVLSVNVTANNVTLKYFWSASCPYCKKEEPILQKFLQEHPSLNFIRIDVNKRENEGEIARYNARSTPTFALIDRESTKIAVGFLTEKQLSKFICSKLKDEACNKLRDD